MKELLFKKKGENVLKCIPVMLQTEPVMIQQLLLHLILLQTTHVKAKRKIIHLKHNSTKKSNSQLSE
jgi:hypothetical protein